MGNNPSVSIWGNMREPGDRSRDGLGGPDSSKNARGVARGSSGAQALEIGFLVRSSLLNDRESFSS